MQKVRCTFPTARVFGRTDRPMLHLITCGGSFDPTAGSYRGNVVVFTHLTDVR